MADVTIVMKRVNEPLEYGVVMCDTRGRITRFLEKPQWGQVFSDTVNTGIYVMKKEVLGLIPKDIFFDFSKDLFPQMLKDHLALYGCTLDGYWCDIGDLDSFLKCNIDVLSGQVKSKLIQLRLNVGQTNAHHMGARMPSFYAANAIAPEGTGPYVVADEGARIEYGSKIQYSIVGEGSRIENGCSVSGAIIGSKVCILEGATVCEGSVIGEGCRIGTNSRINENSKLWPGKTVDDDCTVRGNIVWGRGSNKIFESGSVIGEIGSDITPETCARLGGALGSISAGGEILVCDDGANSSKMFKSALIGGIMSTGAKVYDGKSTSKSVMVFGVLKHGYKFGVHILSEGARTNISIVDRRGLTPSRSMQRNIQTALFREDYTRAPGTGIKKIEFLNDLDDEYINENMMKYHTERAFKVAVIGRGKELKYLKSILKKAGYQVANLKEENRDGLIKIGIRNGKMFLKDENGCEVNDGGLFLMMITAFLSVTKKNTICLPIWAPRICDDIAAHMGADIKRYTSDSATITPYGEEETILFDDPVLSGIVALKYLASYNKKLCEEMEALPKYSVVISELPVKREAKGKIISQLNRESKNGADSLEGVDIQNETGRVLIIPHPTKPLYRIYAEGFKEETAKELCGFFEDRIRKMDSEVKI